MEVLNLIANKALGGMITRRINSAERERQIYWDILFSCGVNCYEHNDVSWINKGLEMAKAVGRYRATVSILKTCIPFNHKDGVFGGKRKAAMYDKMKDKFEAVLLAEINKQVAEDSKPKTVAAYEFEKAKENFEKKALANGITVEVRVVETVALAA
jgi:hypothetical protein